MKRIKVLQWASLSPDLNLIEMLWRGLQTAVQKSMPANVNEMKQHCKV